MTRPDLEVGTILRQYGPDYLAHYGDHLSTAQQRAVRDLAACRTAALGGHVEACDQCGYQRIAYNSCRNRHCPKCQAGSRAEWLADRAAELLPVPYFHVVFTLPHQLAPLALQNQRLLYGLLFRTAAQTMLQLAAQPQHLGADIGFVGVLHTWGQNLQHHPHLHCVVPGGGLAPDRQRWVAAPPNFFLPVAVLSQVFRGKFLEGLEQAFARGQVGCHGQLADLARPPAFAALLAECAQLGWVVYVKPPFGGPEQVLKYLARYTHRVAIANRRLLECRDDRVTFTWKDYAHGNVEKTLTLDVDEFIRRFLLHIVPSGFVRIRHYGLFANRHRQDNLDTCRRLLGASTPPALPEPVAAVGDPPASPEARPLCPCCGQGHMVVVEYLAKERAAAPALQPVAACDSS